MSSPRTFVITGASKGIGFATATTLHQQGHAIIGLARTAPEDGSAFAEFHTVDLADQSARTPVFEEIAARLPVDGVLNNVGLVHPAPLEDITLADFDQVIDLNLRVTLQLTQALVPGMKERGWGRVVSTSSLVAAGVPHRTSYAAAKTALISFTRSWALELAPFGITVNAVAPGPVATELFNTNNPPGSESRQRYIDGIPIGRTGTPEEVAAANAFFFSDGGAFTTGQCLFVDGGSSTGRAPI
jgi:NAD(P)-dependent dehydrogenase (short-subunit alcohol dehydrogenase family)